MTVSLSLLVAAAVLAAVGGTLLLTRSLTRILLGAVVLGNGVNLLVLASTGSAGDAPLLYPHVIRNRVTDPLPQAIALTAIVITSPPPRSCSPWPTAATRSPAPTRSATTPRTDWSRCAPSSSTGAANCGTATARTAPTAAPARTARPLPDARRRLRKRVREERAYQARANDVSGNLWNDILGADPEDYREGRERGTTDATGRPGPHRPVSPVPPTTPRKPAASPTPAPARTPAPVARPARRPRGRRHGRNQVNALVPLPVLLPLCVTGLKLAIGPRLQRFQRFISLAVLGAVLVLSVLLMIAADRHGPLSVHLGDFRPAIGITLVADRLAGLMLTVSSAVTLLVHVYSLGQGMADRDDQTPVGVFHPAYLILVAGVSCTFLAGDLVNLYVGFEIMLVASFVLLTIGGTATRIRAGSTYVIISLFSSVLFLVAIAMTYAFAGTVNFAQLAGRLQEAPDGARTLLEAMLLTVFAIKRPCSRSRPGCPTRTRPPPRRSPRSSPAC